MRKLVIGIAIISAGCVLAGAGQQSIKPPRPDEELIVTAILASKYENFADFHADSKSAIGVYDQWDTSQGSFDACLTESIDELEKGLRKSEKYKNRFSKDPEGQAAQKKYVAKMTQGLAEMKRVLPGLASMKQSPTMPKVALKSIKLPVGFLFRGGTVGYDRTKTITTSGKKIRIYMDHSFAYPVFSKDQNYAFVRVGEYEWHHSDLWFCLARTPKGWKVVADGGVHYV